MATGRCTPSSSNWVRFCACRFIFADRIAKFLSTFPRGERGDRTRTYSSSWSDNGCFRRHGDSGLSADQSHWQASGKFDHHGHWSLLIGGIVMWMVDAMNAKVRGGWPNRCGKPHPYLEDGSHEPGASHVDWRLPDFFGESFPVPRARCRQLQADKLQECRGRRPWSSHSFSRFRPW